MGVEFYGLARSKTENGTLETRLWLSFEHPAFLSFNVGNAAAVLGLLGLQCINGGGACTLPEARRAIMQAKARFERKAGEFTREGGDEKLPGRPRVIRGALDEDGLRMRIDRFEEFVNTMDRMGATSLYWA